jgi:hypothetical protein
MNDEREMGKEKAMNWKLWTWLGQVRSLRAELEEADRKLETYRTGWLKSSAAQAEMRIESAKIIEKCQQPLGKVEEVERKLKEGLGAMSEGHPTWEAVKLFMEWQRRGAHVETLAPFTSDREAWIAIGRAQGIERAQLALVRTFIEARKGK